MSWFENAARVEASCAAHREELRKVFSAVGLAVCIAVKLRPDDVYKCAVVAHQEVVPDAVPERVLQTRERRCIKRQTLIRC